MDSEKHWLIQHSTSLQSKVEALEKQLANEEFRFSLLDSIDKSREKEKDLIELHLNRAKTNEVLLAQEVNLFDQERIKSKQILRKIEERSVGEVKTKSEEVEKLNRENQYLKEKIIIGENLIEELKGQVGALQEKFLKLAKENEHFEIKKMFSFEFYEKELGKKSLEIENLEKQVKELGERNEELQKRTFGIDNEKKELFEKVCAADGLQLQQIQKVINGEDLYRESNSRLKVLMEEYEKKFPIIIEQKKNYERLIRDHQELKFELGKKNEELNSRLEEMDVLKNENSELESLREKNVYLSNQLIQIFSNSPLTTSGDYSSVKTLITKALDYGEIFNSQEKIIEKLEEENQYLKSRPVLIEEPSPATEKFLYLESLYQKTNENNSVLKKKLEELQILNSELSGKLSTSLQNEEKLKNSLKSEKFQSKGQSIQSLSPNLPLPIPFESLAQSQDFHLIYLSEYKSEIKRLQHENSNLLFTIRSHKTVLFENIQIFKSKIESLISEKAEIFIESQKLKSRILDLEQSLQDSQKSLQALQESSSKPKLDIKEFAAINELHECRIEISKNSELIQILQSENSILKSENRALHEEIERNSFKQATNSQISKLADLTQENFIIKSSNSLLQERIKSLVSTNLNLEDRVCALDKEINLKALSEAHVLPAPEQEALNLVKSAELEDKIKQLIQENKKKDDQITNLMKNFAQSQDLPSVLSKIVTVVHRLSKT